MKLLKGCEGPPLGFEPSLKAGCKLFVRTEKPATGLCTRVLYANHYIMAAMPQSSPKLITAR